MVKKKEYATSIKTGKKEEIKDNTKIATAEGTIVHNPTETKNTTETKKQISNTNLSKNVEQEESKPKFLDYISAPLSQPAETIKGGLKGGAEAVMDKRESISSKVASGDKEGAKKEALGVVGTTVVTTAAVAALVVAAKGLVTAALGTIGKKAAGIGLKTAAARGADLGTMASTRSALELSKATAKAGFTEAAAGIGTFMAIDKFIYSPQETATWAAVDNIAGATSFMVKKTVDAVKWDGMDPDVAQTQIEKSIQSIENARTFVDIQTSRNPKYYAAKEMFDIAADTAMESIEIEKIRLAAMIEKQQSLEQEEQKNI